MAGYVDPFEQERKTTAAALAVGSAASVPAAQAAQAAQLARRFRLPTPVAAEFADEYAARAQTEDARANLAKSPALASWIAEQPDRAQIAKNDLSTLSGLEQVARDYSGAVAEGIVGRGFGDVLSGAGRLYDAAARGIAAPLRAVGLGPLLDQPIPLWADPSYQLLKKPGQSLQNIGKMAGPASENRTFGTDVASGLSQIAAQAGLYMLGGPVAGTATLYAGGAEAAGSKVDGDNASPMAKDLVTVGGAAITGITEKYALDKILGPLAVPVRNQIAAALARIGIGAAAEGAQEMAENIGQDVLRKLITNPNAEIDFGESLYEGGVGAAVGGIARTAVEAALHIKRKQNVQQRADAGKDLLDKIVAAAGTTELHKADPAAFAALAQQMAQTTGAPTEVFIDARQVSEALQQSGITPEQAVAAMPSLADQLEAATVMGGDVVIPIGEFAAGIAGSPIEPLLMQHVRTEADGLSQADGKKKTAADQQMAGTAKKAEEQAANLTPLEKEREKVKQDILEQLNATKRFTPDIHEAQAELTATVLSNIARRAGKTVEQLFNGKPLKVQASGVFADALQQVNLEAGSGFRSLAVGQTTIDYSVSGNGQTAEISMVKTPKSDRGQGAARAAMKQFLAGADAKGVTVFLTAEPMDKGVSKSRLQAFYKSLGFKPNTGRNADYRARAGMVRRPQGVPHDQTKTPEFKRFSQDAPLVSRADAQTRQFKSGEKIVVEAYHGTKRPDRIGTKFLKKRATSGPMAYHTSEPTLASSYAIGKQDTSLANEDQDYSNWFKVKIPGDRSTTDLVRSWHRLDPATKDRIAELAPRVMFSDEQEADGGNKIELGPEGHDSGTGSYDYNLASTRTTWDRRGNPLKALVEDWLNSGNLFNDEERFMQVLKLAGFPMELVEYDSPTSEYPFVYKNYIAMYKPLVTSDVPQEVVEALNAAAKKDRSRAQPSGADSWDKNTRTLREWVAAFNSEDNTYVWTSIPDKVTDVFKSLGYDGIVDWSGKGGGPAALVAPVYIPFEETQIKSAIGNKGTFDSTKNDILKQDAPTKPSPGHIEAMKREKVLNRLLECLSG